MASSPTKLRPTGGGSRRKSAKSPPVQKFAFISVNPNGNEVDAEENLRKVRSHVTKTYYQNVREAEEKEQPASQQQQQQRNNRRTFNLRPSPSPTATIARHRSLTPRAAPKLRKPPDEDSNSTADSPASSSSSDVGDIVFQELDPSRLDPFDVLPVKGHILMDRTLQIFSLPEIRDLAPNLMPHSGLNSWGRLGGKEKAWRPDLGLNEDDELLFSQRLYFASVLCDQMQKKKQTYATFQYQRQIILLLQDKIATYGNTAPVEVIMAIIAMAVQSILGGDVDQARTHLNVAWNFINTRGGLASFVLPARRIIAWSDIIVRTGLSEEHQLQWELTLDNKCQSPPTDLAEEAFRREQLTLARLPSRTTVDVGLIYRLHLLGLASSRAWRHYDDHPAIHNVFYVVNHQLAQLAEQDALTGHSSTDDLAVILRCLSVASRIFIRATLGHTFDNIVTRQNIARLKAALTSGTDGLMVWYRQGAAEALLWILFIAIKAFPHSVPDHSWFVAQIGPVISLLRLDRVAFEATMKSFPWTDQLGVNACEQVFNEVKAFQSPISNQAHSPF